MTKHFDLTQCLGAGMLRLALVLAICLLAATAPVLGQGSGNCLSFDGVNEYVSVPGGGGLNNASQGTIEMWVRWSGTQDEAFNGFGPVLARQWNGVESNNVIALTTSDPSTAVVTWRPYTIGSPALTSATVIGDGVWRHIAITFTSGDHRMYVDGVLEDTSTTTGSMFNNSGMPLTIGAWIGDGDGYSTSRIDEVRIWSTVRTADEIRSRMCQRLTGGETGLVAYYRLDASSGSLASNDQGTASLDGTLYNMEDVDWVVSGAPLGDASTVDFDATGGFTAGLTGGAGDGLTAVTTGGTVSGLAVYRVDGSPNVTAPPAGFDALSTVNYFGVFVAGSASSTYTVTYSYDGHPGISDESQLGLARRADNADGAWADAGATLDTGANTLTKTGEVGTEYVLAGSGNGLPVELGGFTVN